MLSLNEGQDRHQLQIKTHENVLDFVWDVLASVCLCLSLTRSCVPFPTFILSPCLAPPNLPIAASQKNHKNHSSPTWRFFLAPSCALVGFQWNAAGGG